MRVVSDYTAAQSCLCMCLNVLREKELLVSQETGHTYINADGPGCWLACFLVRQSSGNGNSAMNGVQTCRGRSIERAGGELTEGVFVGSKWTKRVDD